jgi:hypothetical protein
MVASGMVTLLVAVEVLATRAVDAHLAAKSAKSAKAAEELESAEE